MWKGRTDKQLEITVNIAHKGCAVACIVCPQDKLSSRYNLYPKDELIRDLSFDMFKKMIDKVPLTTRIDFAGYTEPYLNKDCSKMLKYAHDKGHIVSVFTTLVGANESDVDLLLEICQHPTRPFSSHDQDSLLCIHLPDDGGVMPVKITPKYKRVLKYLVEEAQRLNLGLEIGGYGGHIRFMTMDEGGRLHKEILDVFPVNKTFSQFKTISRASNLDDNTIAVKAPTIKNYDGGIGRKTGKIICKTNSLNYNVLIPNGDVQLCCMDYGLDAKIGNLLEDDYEYLHTGDKMQYIIDRMNDDSLEGDIICRRCENAGYEFKEEIIVKTRSMQETLDILYEKLDSSEKVYYPRFGDGDFEIMLGTGRCIEHEASLELQKELRESFQIQDENYIKGVMINESTFDGHGLVQHPPDKWKPLLTFIQNNFDNPENFVFDSHVLLTYIAVKQQELMIDFLDRFIRPKKKLFIGSVDKNAMEQLVGKIDYYVKIPVAKVEEQSVFKGAYYYMDEWYPKVLEHVDDVDLVIPTAGMAGRVLCKRLWNLDKQVHCIELGSIVDAVVGKKSRSWIVRSGDFIKPLLIGF